MKDAAFYPGQPRKFTRLAAAEIVLVGMRVEFEECTEIAARRAVAFVGIMRRRVCNDFSVRAYDAGEQETQGLAGHGKFRLRESHAT